MALICDTGAVYALYDADDAHHASSTAVVEAEPGPLFLPVILLAEIDYLLTTRLGADAALDFLQGVEAGAFTLVPLASEDLRRCRELERLSRWCSHVSPTRQRGTRFPSQARRAHIAIGT